MARFLKFAALTAAGSALLLLAAAAVLSLAVDPNDYKAGIIRLVQQRYQRTLTIPGKISLVLYPRAGADLGQVSLSEHGGPAQFATMDSARVSLAWMPLLLRREIVIDRIEVRGVQASVVRFANGSMSTGDLTSGQPSAAAPVSTTTHAPQVALAIDAIRIGNARLLFDDRKTGRILDISHLNIDSGAIARGVPSHMALSANVHMSKPVLDSALTLNANFLPDRERRRIAFTELEADLDISPRDAKARVSGRIEVDLDKDEFDAELKGKVDDSAFDAVAGLRERAYHLTLHVDKLDLGRYHERMVPSDSGTPSAADMFDLTPLSSLRASGGIHIGELTVGALHASNVRAALRSEASKLALQPISADLYGGTSGGSLALDFSHSFSNPHITLVQNLKGIRVGALLQDTLGNVPLEGVGDVMVDVNTEGASAAQMRQALSGSAALRLRDGVLHGVGIGAMVVGGKAASGAASASLSTTFSALGASFTIAGGIAHNADLVARAPLLSITGAGDIDLAREQVDYTLACTLVATSNALPVRLSGPWDAIAWHVDGKEISAAAVKEKARDKLKKAIRGLLKRH